MPNLNKCNLKELLVEIEELMRYQAQMHEIKLSLQVTESLGTYKLDGQRVTQILLNLISNALKFSAEG